LCFQHKTKGVEKDDPETWLNTQWSRTGIYREGMVGGSSLWTPRIIKNRQNANLHKVGHVVHGSN